MFESCSWHNEPGQWSLDERALTVRSDEHTDFWRDTYYGFTRDSGHFFGHAWAGDFTASLRIQGQYQALYDQAGMMVRIDAKNWIKAGIELSDGAACLGSVLTIDRSDWSTSPYAGDPSDLYVRVTVQAGVLRLQTSADGRRWPLLRLCPFPSASRYHVGPMLCTPERSGLEVTFSHFEIGPPNGKALHDLS